MPGRLALLSLTRPGGGAQSTAGPLHNHKDCREKLSACSQEKLLTVPVRASLNYMLLLRHLRHLTSVSNHVSPAQNMSVEPGFGVSPIP